MSYICLTLYYATKYLEKSIDDSPETCLQVSQGDGFENKFNYDLPQFSEALAKNTWLKQLDFSFMSLTDENFKNIMQGLSENISVEEIIFKFCEIDDEGIDSLAEVLASKTTNIKSIDLRNNRITDKGIIKLSDAIRKKGICVRLYLSDNLVTEQGAKEIEKLVAENLVSSITIKWQVGWTFFKGRAAVFAQQLKQNHTLTSVSLANNQITSEELKQLVYTLCSNRALRVFNLSNNMIGNSGIKAFARVLVVNPLLEELDLSHNQISDEGAKAIAEALIFNRKLTTLNLKSNVITSVGALALFKAVQQRGIPLKLDLDDNPIDETILSQAYIVNMRTFFKICKEGAIPREKRKRIRSDLNQLNDSMLIPGMTLSGATWLVYVWSSKPPSLLDNFISSFWQPSAPTTSLLIEGRDEKNNVFVRKYNLVRKSNNDVIDLQSEEYMQGNCEPLINMLNEGYYICSKAAFSQVNKMITVLQASKQHYLGNDWAVKILREQGILDSSPDFSQFRHACCLDEAIVFTR